MGRAVAKASPCADAMPTRRPVKRSRAEADRKDVDVAERQAGRSEQRQRIAGKPSGMRPAAVASRVRDHRAVSRQRDAAVAGRGFEGQHDHPGCCKDILPISRTPAPRTFDGRSAPRHCRRASSGAADAGDEAVPRRQASVPRRHPVLPDGRLLRDVLRGRAGHGARARAHPHVALERQRRRSHPDVWRALSRAGRLPGPPRPQGLPRRHLRAGRRSEKGQGRRQA